jgi:hypothetical protein
MKRPSEFEKSTDLRAFMAKNFEGNQEIEFVASKRFLNHDGKPEKWYLRTITAKEDAQIRKSCTRKVPSKRARGAYIPETDINEYLSKMLAECVVHPNLNDKELQDSYGVMCASDLIAAMLNPGEYAELTKKVQEINGFDTSMEELVEDAKN